MSARRIGQAMREAAAALGAAGIENAGGDARLLMAEALGVDRSRLLLMEGAPLPEAEGRRFAAFISERLRRRPVSQIIGWREFYGRRFRVTSDVLDPRPETETLISAALEAPFSRVLDLGTGTGCILLTLLAERPQAKGIGVDISPGALEVAKSNRDDLSIGSRAKFIQSDWYGDVEGRFDLIVANPPYIGAAEIPALAPEVREWEPRLALVPGRGEDALLAYRRIASGAREHLLPGGRLMVEAGAGQAAEVLQLFAEAGLAQGRIVEDLDGRGRVVSAVAPPRERESGAGRAP